MKKGRPPVYIDITYEDLGKYIGRKGIVRVSKSWVEPLMGVSVEESPTTPPTPPASEKIDYKITNLND